MDISSGVGTAHRKDRESVVTPLPFSHRPLHHGGVLGSTHILRELKVSPHTRSLGT